LFKDLPGVAAEEGGDLGGVHTAAATHPHHSAHPGHLYTELKGLCHEMNNFLKVLKIKSVLLSVYAPIVFFFLIFAALL
jgi:hypothetical protein